MPFEPRDHLEDDPDDGAGFVSPLSGNRAQRMQRLQVGVFGIVAMVMVVGLADIIMSTAESNQTGALDELPPVTAQDVPPPQQRDPLAEAGVVPDLPAGPEAAQTGTPLAPVESGDVPPPAANP